MLAKQYTSIFLFKYISVKNDEAFHFGTNVEIKTFNEINCFQTLLLDNFFKSPRNPLIFPKKIQLVEES